jgi:phosphoribosylglycinamide formyltransferase 1
MGNIVFLVSGGGATLKFIFHAIAQLGLPIRIAGIIADRHVAVEEFAINNEIPFRQISYSRKDNSYMLMALKEFEPDVIVTNIHKILDIETLESFEGKFINLHYSILPAYGGLIGMETIQRAKLQNVGFVGGTCHEVNEEVDAGRILFQGLFAVNWEKDEQCIDTVFKLSCILMLGGILQKTGLAFGQCRETIINDNLVLFSPPIPVEELEFTKHIWNKLQN